MKLLCVAIFSIILMGCWGDTISFIEISRQEMDQRFGSQYIGYATWGNDEFGFQHCKVYMMPLDEYPSDQCYDAVLNHELRHCDEGNFHAPGNGQVEGC